MQGGPERDAGLPPEPAPTRGPQPMRLGTVLEVGFRILMRHWAILLLLALFFVGPAALLTTATGLRFTEAALDIFPGLSDGVIDESTLPSANELSRLGEPLIGWALATIVAGVLGSIGALGLSAVVVADYHARKIELGTALRVCLRRAPTVLGFILVTTFIVVGMLLIALALLMLAALLLPSGSGGAGGPGAFLMLIIVVALAAAVLYMSVRWAPAFPAIVNEDLGWRKALTRSWYLSGNNVWRIIFIIAFAGILTMLASTVVAQLLSALLIGAVAPAIGLDALIAEGVGLAIAAVLLAPVAPVLTTVLYFDLRARRDVPVAETPPTTSYR